ncbi:MAG: glycosyltransferase family 2 protein [Chitinispirillales bacterium]|jgi:glycosyltransferase involved in cell wall biosynthesis|nr:glycosyltransferase family 2 protein [Chitinispirillales bacterium]
MKNKWPKDTHILIPSYKSVKQLRVFVDSLMKIVPKEFICVVDDASNDGTFEYCADMGIVCLRHDANRGKGAALKTGFDYLISDADNREPPINTKKTKWILTMDADGQHSPTDIHRFIKETRKHPTTGLCIGARDMRLGFMPPTRIISNRLTSGILSLLTWYIIKDSQCGYRIYSRKFIESIKLHCDRFEMESEVIIKAAAKRFPIRFVRVQTLYLSGGPSHISHFADTLRWIAAVLRVRFGLLANTDK